MRVLILAVILLVSACATNAPETVYGSQEKDGWTAANKILDGDANYVQRGVEPCSRGRILWCSGNRGVSDCECVFEHDVDRRVTRMLGSRDPGRNRQFDRSRRNH